MDIGTIVDLGRLKGPRVAITTQPEGDTATTLIAVKAQVPPLRTRLVDRERLLRRLLEQEPGCLTVVISPAGWGKTTLLSQWARHIDSTSAVAWVSLDESDDEPVRFWTYALTALQKVAPAVVDGALRALGAPGVDPVAVALPMLLNSLAATTERHVLVLDDYHVLRDVQLHNQVEFLLTYAPASLRCRDRRTFRPAASSGTDACGRAADRGAGSGHAVHGGRGNGAGHPGRRCAASLGADEPDGGAD